jgi:Putative beta-barrel porin 2
MVVLTMACLSAFAATPIRAQEVSPVVDDRVESDVVEAPAVPVSEVERTSGLDLGVVISAAYDDNIFLSKTKPESDMVYRVAPSIAYTQGDEEEGEGGFIKFAYRPTAVVYADNKDDNRFDHQAAITAGWRGKVTKITYTGAAQKLGDATADTGRQTDRVEFQNEIRAAWIPREKVTLEVAAGNKQADYADPELFDSNKTYGEVAVRYAYSPKTEVGLAYQAGNFKVDGAGKQTTQQLTANVAWQPREKIRVNLEAGAEHRKTENGTNVNPVVEGRIDWQPRKGTSLYLTAYQREEASAFFAGQNYNVKGATAGISQRLGGNWTARLEAGRETASYSQVAGSGTSGRKDKIWFVRPALEYKISDEFDISLFYRVSDNSSTESDFGYDQKMAGIELNYRF